MAEALPYGRITVHHRPARIIFTVLTVALVTTFGSGAEGRRVANAGLATTRTEMAATVGHHEWCANLANAPAIAAAAEGLGTIDANDGEPLDVLARASDRPFNPIRARQLGSEYAALAETWPGWKRACNSAYADRE